MFYLFVMKEIHVCNFADNTNLSACDNDLEKVLQKLQYSTEPPIFWFKSNFMKLKTYKCHLVE